MFFSKKKLKSIFSKNLKNHIFGQEIDLGPLVSTIPTPGIWVRMSKFWVYSCDLALYSAFAHSEARSDSEGFRYPIPLKIGRDWIYIITIHLLQKNPIHNFPGWLSLPFWKERKRIQFRRSEHAKQCSEIQSLKRHSSYQKTISTDGFCLFSHGVTFLMGFK